MYLKSCWLENTGPVSKINIEMPFHSDGSPKPVVLVGGNGTGKTVMISHVVDSLTQIAQSVYRKVFKDRPSGWESDHYRADGAGGDSVNSEFSLAILEFVLGELTVFTVEGVGEMKNTEYGFIDVLPQNLSDFRTSAHGRYKDKGMIGGEKEGYLIDEKDLDHVRRAFSSTSICYFPVERNETPYWLEPYLVRDDSQTEPLRPYQNHAIPNPLVVAGSAVLNQAWLQNVLLDRLLQLSLQTESQEIKTWDNVNRILQISLDESTAELTLGPRTSATRLSIHRNGKPWLPSILHLSTGQGGLFNLFATIIRYSDGVDALKSLDLDQIKGIVIIDEIDAHIHANLQHDSLPKLIRLFPKVQFIISSHAPLFALGMDHEFGADGYYLLEMPHGDVISAERFKEFQRSLEYYQQTKAFEDEQRERLRLLLETANKPIVLTEGDTDPDYLRTALELNGRSDLLLRIDIEWIGSARNGQQFFTGDKNLNNAGEFLRANPDFISKRRVLLLYDSDTNKPSTNEGNLWVRSLPYNTHNQKVKKGIENMFGEDLFDANDRRFYSSVERQGDYGQVTTISEFKKRIFCDYLCQERRDESDFAAFGPVIAMLEDFANNALTTSESCS